MRHELIIIWDTGERDIFSYKDEATAAHAEQNMRLVFGNQIAWAGIRPHKNKGKGVE